MEKPVAAALYAAYGKVVQTIFEAGMDLQILPQSDLRDALMEAHKDISVQIMSRLCAPLSRAFPELDTEKPDGPPDDLIEPEFQDAVDRLTAQQIADIDRALLSDCAPS